MSGFITSAHCACETKPSICERISIRSVKSKADSTDVGQSSASRPKTVTICQKVMPIVKAPKALRPAIRSICAILIATKKQPRPAAIATHAMMTKMITGRSSPWHGWHVPCWSSKYSCWHALHSVPV